MNPQLRNWDNFCQYHVGEWHGIKTRYSPDREVIKSWQVVTKLEMNKDVNTINHQDYLTYNDGETELKTFGPYTKPITSALFLDSSFCWGSKKVVSGSIFVFEIGFRFEDKRMLGYTRYGEHGNLQYISTGPEHLNKLEDNSSSSVNQIHNDWQGKLKLLNTISTLTATGSELGADLVNVKSLEGDNKMKKHWRSGFDEPEKLFAAHGWKASVVQPGDEEANFGRYTNKLPPRTVPDAKRVFLITATK